MRAAGVRRDRRSRSSMLASSPLDYARALAAARHRRSRRRILRRPAPRTAVACGPRGCARQAASGSSMRRRMRCRAGCARARHSGRGRSTRQAYPDATYHVGRAGSARPPAGAAAVTLANGQLSHDDVGQVVSSGGSTFTVWQTASWGSIHRPRARRREQPCVRVAGPARERHRSGSDVALPRSRSPARSIRDRGARRAGTRGGATRTRAGRS